MVERARRALHALWRGLRGLLRWRAPADPRHRAGARAEGAAARYLKRHGYRILERNYRTRLGELDLVVFRAGTVAFVEVRSLDAASPIEPAATVTATKRRRLVRAAHDYCRTHRLEREGVGLRFDFVGVRLDGRRVVDIRHVENAFQVTRRGF